MRVGEITVAFDGSMQGDFATGPFDDGIAEMRLTGALPKQHPPDSLARLAQLGAIRDLAAEAGELSKAELSGEHVAGLNANVQRPRRETRLAMGVLFDPVHSLQENVREVLQRLEACTSAEEKKAWALELADALSEGVYSERQKTIG